jgi:hypothetical protein
MHAAIPDGPLHTLLHPILSDVAGRAFFRGGSGELPFTGYGEAAKIGHRNSMTSTYFERFADGLPDDQLVEFAHERCRVAGPQCQILLRRLIQLHPGVDALSEIEVELAELDGASSREHLDLAARRLYEDGASSDSGAITAAQALALTDDYMRSYSHGVPYESTALESVWASCREKPPSRSECERRIAARPPTGGRASSRTQQEFEEAVDACLSRTAVGRLCQDGALQVRTLLDTGETPELLRAWRFKQQGDQGT